MNLTLHRLSYFSSALRHIPCWFLTVCAGSRVVRPASEVVPVLQPSQLPQQPMSCSDQE